MILLHRNASKIVYWTWYDFKKDLEKVIGHPLLNQLWLEVKPKKPLPWNYSHFRRALSITERLGRQSAHGEFGISAMYEMMDTLKRVRRAIIRVKRHLETNDSDCSWRNRWLDMQSEIDLKAGLKSGKYALPCLITKIGETHKGRFN